MRRRLEAEHNSEYILKISVSHYFSFSNHETSCPIPDIRRVAATRLPTKWGEFQAIGFQQERIRTAPTSISVHVEEQFLSYACGDV
jgi:hypothetical protein